MPQHWVGDGFLVRPVFGDVAFSKNISPFLMFDYGEPRKLSPDPKGKRKGVGQHPHRGFETVTIAWQGEVEHRDSLGNHDIITQGGVQWMTAGRGIIHEEYISERVTKEGGMFEMAQLWVNLPAANKMTAPKYQPITINEIPTINLNDDIGSIRVISGNFEGTKGPAQTFTPITLMEITLKKNKPFDFLMEKGFNTIIFSKKGSIKICNEKTINQAQVALLSIENDRIILEGLDDTNTILILAGLPIGSY